MAIYEAVAANTRQRLACYCSHRDGRQILFVGGSEEHTLTLPKAYGSYGWDSAEHALVAAHWARYVADNGGEYQPPPLARGDLFVSDNCLWRAEHKNARGVRMVRRWHKTKRAWGKTLHRLPNFQPFSYTKATEADLVSFRYNARSFA